MIGQWTGGLFEHKVASVLRNTPFYQSKGYAPIDDDYYYEMVTIRAFEKYGIHLTVERRIRAAPTSHDCCLRQDTVATVFMPLVPGSGAATLENGSSQAGKNNYCHDAVAQPLPGSQGALNFDDPQGSSIGCIGAGRVPSLCARRFMSGRHIPSAPRPGPGLIMSSSAPRASPAQFKSRFQDP
jgi:hypothetical protein